LRQRIVIILLGMFLCAPPAAALTVTTWNFEWLSTEQSLKIKPSLRSEQDYKTLSGYFNQIDPDVLAFQEINDRHALHKVLDKNRYQIIFSQRTKQAQRQFDDINQYTGFAIKRDFTVVNMPDLDLHPLQTNKLRFASYVVLERPQTKKLHLLSVHLKAGCSGAKRNNYACRQLVEQSEVLNRWINERAANNESFIIAGDFNHNLAYPNDWLWQLLTNNSEQSVALITKATPADCLVRSKRKPTKTHQFRQLIDHIVVSKDLFATPGKQTVFNKQDVLTRQLSDHCPISTTIH